MKKTGRRLDEFLMTFPSFAWLAVFFVVPTLIVFAYAFKPHDIYGNIGEGWTISTFEDITRKSYLLIFWRTIWLSILTTFICLSLALPMGYYIARVNPYMRKILLLLVVIPFWSSFLVRIFAWKSLLHPEGLLKQVLVFLHVVGSDTSLLYHSGTVLMVMVYSYLPFAVLPVFAAASKFDYSLIEAAKDLGASRFQAFTKVFIPGIRQSIWTALLMVFIPAIGAYVIPDVVGGAQSEMLGNKIAQKIFVERDLPQASVLSVFLALAVLVPIIIVTLIPSRLGRVGISARGKQ